ncbi:MAG TPA: flagellar hook-basal body complex protein FliE [Caulobacteraceae bacterium]|jgi:flagellar hook-basal body complex protein FliE
MITPLAAMKAYTAAQNTASVGGGGAATGAGGLNFADLVKNAVQNTTESTKAAEAQMAAQVQGKAELIDVVTSVAAAEASLETVMAVRDQVIAAYQEIMRMPI